MKKLFDYQTAQIKDGDRRIVGLQTGKVSR